MHSEAHNTHEPIYSSVKQKSEDQIYPHEQPKVPRLLTDKLVTDTDLNIVYRKIQSMKVGCKSYYISLVYLL